MGTYNPPPHTHTPTHTYTHTHTQTPAMLTLLLLRCILNVSTAAAKICSNFQVKQKSLKFLAHLSIQSFFRDVNCCFDAGTVELLSDHRWDETGWYVNCAQSNPTTVAVKSHVGRRCTKSVDLLTKRRASNRYFGMYWLQNLFGRDITFKTLRMKTNQKTASCYENLKD